MPVSAILMTWVEKFSAFPFNFLFIKCLYELVSMQGTKRGAKGAVVTGTEIEGDTKFILSTFRINKFISGFFFSKYKYVYFSFER